MARQRVRDVDLAALHLEGSWIDELHVYPTPEGSESPQGVKVSKPQVLQNPDDEADYVVRLRVKITTEASTVDVTASGRFRLVASEPSPADLRMIEYNGPSILYGVIRGVVSTVTALSLHGRIDLPSVNLASLIEG